MKSFLIRDILSGQSSTASDRNSLAAAAAVAAAAAAATNDTTSSTTNSDQRDSQQAQLAQQFHHHLSQTHSPLDALFQMTSSTFDALKRGEKRKDRNSDTSSHGTPQNFSGKQSSKKKRKSRTAFTNYQICELERRFGIQKYLSPTDRDEIAITLNLSNAQVITWFQNRRAKLKRDLEEKKRDIETASLVNMHKTFLEHLQAFSQLNAAMRPSAEAFSETLDMKPSLDLDV